MQRPISPVQADRSSEQYTDGKLGSNQRERSALFIHPGESEHAHETRFFPRQLSAKKERIPGVDHISTLFLMPTTKVACDIVGPIDARFEKVCGNRPHVTLVFPWALA